ncbi:hypothetical protein HP550_13615 [Cellulomonas humilata]|uniref:NACHT domain-containing protein n=1 Tax=Cellulomonas humilata TaxID=144055 RepID=A0A7Y6A4H4_9CELL|nr:hypothetical protein [Cellulomonas humilata]NUU18289.1 hypothetical protein [Cellulomonas humilata]
MTDQLTEMSPLAFQQLAAALAIRSLGAKVQAYGTGRDGGRDFTSRGILQWSANDYARQDFWDGYTVFQVKKKETLAATPSVNATWLIREILAELDTWTDPDGSRGEAPDYLVFVSNVPLTPVPATGGLDLLHEKVSEHLRRLKASDKEDPPDKKARAALARRIRAWHVWDGNQMWSLLDAYPEIRRGYRGLLTAGDVLATLRTDSLPDTDLEDALRRHAMGRLIADRYIYFDEAGADVADKTQLQDIVIDLPVVGSDLTAERMILRHVVEHGERNLRAGGALVPARRHIVVAAGPGNGKSTVSRFLAQIYRTAMLDSSSLVTAHATVASGVRTACGRLRVPMPTNRRWPLRIDLAEYAARYSGEKESTLLRWVAEKVNETSALGDVKAHHMDSWLRRWPWLLILDGLDEVTSAIVRRRLVQDIEAFVADADAADADVLMVVTTRPTGYDEAIDPESFERLNLARLSPSQALAYGSLVTGVRLRDEAERLRLVLARLKDAVENETLRLLMQTPLQVLILTFVLESTANLPTDRYGLFDHYYDTVFRRETNKSNDLSRLLQQHKPHVEALHELVGFELQCRSERADGAMASMTLPELEGLVRQILQPVGFDVDGDDATVVQGILNAATLRLVLLAPRPDEGIGFELRSLQELMAARYLTSASDTLLPALRVAAPNPHWRNTWMFAAGRVFAGSDERLRTGMVDLVGQLDKDASGRLAEILPIGPTLALDLVDDGLARSFPNHQEALLRQGMGSLGEPRPDALGIARALVRAADESHRLRVIVANGLRSALSASEPTASSAAEVCQCIGPAVAELGLADDLRGLATVQADQVGRSAATFPERGDLELEAASLAGPAHESRLRAAAKELLDMSDRQHPEAFAAVYEVLSDLETAIALELALETVGDSDLIAEIRDHVLPRILRSPVGSELRRLLQGA